MPRAEGADRSNRQALEAVLVGRTLVTFTVLGINALKTIDPPLDRLVGEKITAVSDDTIGLDRLVTVQMERHQVVINLARTGTVVPVGAAQPWSPTSGSRPTGQMIFEDGSGVDFREPARTKRITFAVQPR